MRRSETEENFELCHNLISWGSIGINSDLCELNLFSFVRLRRRRSTKGTNLPRSSAEMEMNSVQNVGRITDIQNDQQPRLSRERLETRWASTHIRHNWYEVKIFITWPLIQLACIRGHQLKSSCSYRCAYFRLIHLNVSCASCVFGVLLVDSDSISGDEQTQSAATGRVRLLPECGS